MLASNIIAIFALLLSATAVFISYKAFRYSVDNKELEKDRELDREKSEFFIRIEKVQKLYRCCELQVSTLISLIEGSSETIQGSMLKEKQQLLGDFNEIEGCQRQADALYNETYDMTIDGFARHKPRYLALIEEEEELANIVLQRTELIKKSLKELTLS